jgi:RimJ/RimL family protein N-acetyltransferase
LNPAWIVRSGRLLLAPVAWTDLPELQALKADPRVFAQMLGGVRGPVQTVAELAEELAFWGAHGVGIWTVREVGKEALLGLTGLHARPDGRGLALRFAFRPEARGRGLAAEAAGAALRFAHERARLDRVVAAARESNFSSRQVLGAIGMVPCERFVQNGHAMLLYESRRIARC